jgi:molybdate-binding protein/DNA-binding XRE family transcriptional regulator
MAYKQDSTTAGAVRNRLAELRAGRGVAAAALARQAGVSRQTVYAIEAGRYIPNTAVALRLARALEVAVEAIFEVEVGPPAPQRRQQRAVLAGAVDGFPGAPVELCRVGGRLVAIPAVPAPWQLPPADGVLLDSRRPSVLPLDEGRHAADDRLLLAGCDPAASLLARHAGRAGVTLVIAPANSSTALALLKRGLAHVAGTHMDGGEPGEPNRAAVRAAFPASGVAVIAFAGWEEGFVVARGNPLGIRTAADLARAGIVMVNRERGSGSRQLLDRLLRAAGIRARSVRGYGTTSPGHLDAAWRVYAGLADCCIATGSAARAFGLDFVPLRTERYDLVIRREHLALRPVERLLDALTRAPLRRELDALCGYDTRETGRRIG